jgi:hypothetical protein
VEDEGAGGLGCMRREAPDDLAEARLVLEGAEDAGGVDGNRCEQCFRALRRIIHLVSPSRRTVIEFGSHLSYRVK